MKKSRKISFLLVISIAVSMLSFALPVHAYTTPKMVNEQQAVEKINELIDLLEGKYFTCDENPDRKPYDTSAINSVLDADWFKIRFSNFGIPTGNNIANVTSKHYYPLDTKNNPTGLPKGTSCHGFATWAIWYIFASKNTDFVELEFVISNREDSTAKLNYVTLSNLAKPGDLIRIKAVDSSVGHSVIFISCDESGVTVLDCNWNLTCNVKKHKILYTDVSKTYGKWGDCAVAISRATNYSDTTSTQTQYRYYHYTNGTKYSVCAAYGKDKYGGTWTRESTGWLDAPLTMVSKSATSYVHTNTGSACTKAGCTDPSWEGGKYEDANGIPWYREETRTVTEEATPHQHEYDKGKITEKATCTSTGTKTYTCTGCGATKSKTIAKTNHTYNSGTVTKAATCGDVGVKTYACTGCGATKTETISKTGGHTYNDGKVTKAAGCTTAGTMTYTCTVCGKTKTETIAKLGHNYDNGTITKEPTCERTGTRTYTCTSCGAKKTETVEKTSHNYAVITEEIAPTCAEKGKTATEKCTICGATQGGKSIAKLKHTYSTEWTIDEAPTCVKKGSKSHHCTMCDATDGSVSIAKTEHTYGEWKVITPPQPGKKGKQSRTCSVCGDVETNTLSALEEQSNNRIVMTIDSTEATVFGKAAKTDVAPIIVNNRTMLPVRFVAENLGATVAWDGATRKATIRGNGVTIELYIDSTTAYVNGEAVTLDSPAFIQNNRTYMPVRFIAENLGATVEWDAANRQAILTK